MAGPCGWEITQCGCGSCWDTYTPEVRETASTLAAGVMWMATARRYGLCDVVVQPCLRQPAPRDYRTYPVDLPDYGGAYIYQGQWHNTGVVDCPCCGMGTEVDLEGPTTTAGITSVTVDGVLVPATSYLVANGHILVRTDGECWPTCVCCPTQDPDFRVEYKRGEAIPPHVQKAAERLACEWAKACAGNATCALPKRLRSLTRQGVEAVVEELSSDPGQIRTGVPEVDMVIALENPQGRPGRSVIWSPDQPPPRVIS